ncbi:MAG: CPBP family intramembrane glutamic endopeptidase [Pseudanabaenaceae cyanobacterium SKYGB_i_bin29]|nr:CPBP family intramembrane metalloprotease [Pseudanabaenaceae cyanobacterium SKYG29]MDW8420298.1 CPBP family intramembrane glutamic endopeptidase [Pseudanabaenaceae cyanobacterium SKYGB_i_bin29]
MRLYFDNSSAHRGSLCTCQSRQTDGIPSYFLLALSVALGALITTLYFYGKVGVLKLLGRLKLFIPRLEVSCLVLSPLLLIPLLAVIWWAVRKEQIQLVFPLLDSGSTPFVPDSKLSPDTLWSSPITGHVWRTPIDLITGLLILVLATALEELAWRGFVLPHLQANHNAFNSTVILVLMRTVTHVAFFPVGLFISVKIFLDLMIAGIILTSIYNSSRGYLLPTVAFHFFINLYTGCGLSLTEITPSVLSREFLIVLSNPPFLLLYLFLESEGPGSIFAFLYSIWLIITAIIVSKLYGLRNLSQWEPVGNYFLQSGTDNPEC